MNKNECIVLGYAPYEDKENGNMMLRILIGIKSNIERYKGIMVPPPVFLNYDESLISKMDEYISDESSTMKAYYETTDNILTGKTKVSAIKIFD